MKAGLLPIAVVCVVLALGGCGDDDASTGPTALTVKMTDYNIIGEVMGTLVNNVSDQGNRASVTVTRVLAQVGVAAGTAPAPHL